MATHWWRWLALVTLAAAAPPFAKLPPLVGPTSVFRLNDGHDMPIFGLGVYLSEPGPPTYSAVKDALELGYRLIDTAAVYGNEESVGQAIRDSGVPREQIWVTTKLWDSNHGYDEAIEGCEESLRKLGLDYLDLYLIHSPNTGKLVETWDALVELRRRGLARSVGVSNFGEAHLRALEQHGRPLPAVNQIEMHPLIYQERKDLLQHCAQNGILVQAYGSVLFGQKDKMQDETIVNIASATGKTQAQVLLRWGLQMGFQIIPKTIRKLRLQENMDIFDFELSTDQVAGLAGMRGELGAYWNPTIVPVDLGRVDRAPKEDL